MGTFLFSRTARRENRNVPIIYGALLGAACFNIAPGLADDAAAARLETIIVEGRREAIRREAEVFVSSIVADPWEPLARWRRPLCPLVAGATGEQAEWMLLRLSEIARTAAVPLGRKDCRANLYVVLTDQPDLLLQRWRKRNPTMFGDAPPARIKRFLSSSRPVRVWYTKERSTPEGARREGGERIEGGGLIVRDVNPWRLNRTVVPDIVQAIVVVDATQMARLRVAQLADYVALVGMAEIDLDGPFGSTPTIMKLFESSSAADNLPGGLSPWDSAFLAGLYGTDPASTLQLRQITQKVAEEASR
jgi:hypothetical protein